MSNRIHPLHSAKGIAEEILLTGKYPDLNRKTGRTTIRVIGYIKEALEKPYVPICPRDHAGGLVGKNGSLEILRCIKDTARALGLQHFHFNFVECFFSFGAINDEK